MSEDMVPTAASDQPIVDAKEDAPTQCRFCGAFDELRMGCCWDCASSGEEKAARRSVCQHLRKGVENLVRHSNGWGRYDFAWAWERLTKTGDYAPGGYFVKFGIDTMAAKPSTTDVAGTNGRPANIVRREGEG